MKQRLDYFWAKAATQVTGLVFATQLLSEVSDIAQSKPGYWWVVYACGAAFACSLLYAAVLIVLNALHECAKR